MQVATTATSIISRVATTPTKQSRHYCQMFNLSGQRTRHTMLLQQMSLSDISRLRFTCFWLYAGSSNGIKQPRHSTKAMFCMNKTQIMTMLDTTNKQQHCWIINRNDIQLLKITLQQASSSSPDRPWRPSLTWRVQKARPFKQELGLCLKLNRTSVTSQLGMQDIFTQQRKNINRCNFKSLV